VLAFSIHPVYTNTIELDLLEKSGKFVKNNEDRSIYAVGESGSNRKNICGDSLINSA
jgi:hypothetical protein